MVTGKFHHLPGVSKAIEKYVPFCWLKSPSFVYLLFVTFVLTRETSLMFTTHWTRP